MATFAHESIDSGNARVIKVTVTGSESSGPIEFGQWADGSVQIAGTFAAGSVAIEGSNDGVNWSVLNNAQGTAMTGINTNKILSNVEATRYKRVTSTSVTSVDVTFFLLRAQPIRL